MPRIYKSAVHGVAVDMSKLIAQNEKQVAIGNMGVNARGDVLGEGGKILKTREEVMEKFYEANPDLNPRAVVNLKATPKDKKIDLEAMGQNDPIKAAPTVTPKKTKKTIKPDMFDVAENPVTEE